MNVRPLVIFFFTLSALFAGDALGQGSVTLDVTVIDNQGRSRAGLPVVMRERATAAEVSARTDAAGTARFKLTSGEQWLVYVEGRRYGGDFIDIVDGMEVEQSMLITHDPAYEDRIARQSYRRDTLTETDIRNEPLPSLSLPGHTLLELVVRNSEGVALPGMRVRVVDLAASSARWKSSDAAGRVVFHLPVGRSYDIDVEDQLNATYFDPVSMGEGRSMTSYLTMTYDRYRVGEQRRGDTIRQRVAVGEPLRHSKGLLRLHVDRDGMAAAGETVYINDVRSSRVWEAVTDSAGDVVFILPFGTRYLVHFRYQRDVEAVDFTRARKQAEAELGLTYTPDPEQENPGRFVPVHWRNSVWPFDRYRRSTYPDNGPGAGPRMVLHGSGPVRAGRVAGILQAGVRIPSIDTRSIGPLNIGFVLDISGSMASEDNIERMKAGVVRMLKAMRPDDVVSITLFDDKPELLLPAQRLGNDLPRIAALVRTLAPRGGTVVSEALRVAARQVASRKAEGASPFLVLVTDGWISDPIDSVVQLFKGHLAGLPCIPVGTGRLSHAGVLQRIGALHGRQPIWLAGDSLEFQLSRKVFARTAPVVSDIRVRYILPVGLGLSDTYDGRHDSLHHIVTLKDGAAYPEEEFTALLGFTRGPGYRGGKVGIMSSWHDMRRGRRDSVLQWMDPFASPEAAPAAEVRRLYSMATGVASLEHMVRYGVSRSFEPAIASLQDGLKTIDALQPVGSAPEAHLAGLKKILEESLAILRELRRKSLLPH